MDVWADQTVAAIRRLNGGGSSTHLASIQNNCRAGQGQDLYEDLWDGYGKLMSAYGRKLVTLLNKEWKGPHGSRGRWEVRGETLGWRGRSLPARYRRPR